MVTLTNTFDGIVIGSGIGGLTAALELASKGLKLLVLEQHYLLGGACTTYQRKGGYRFDAGVESISGLGNRGPVNHLLKRHSIDGQICWLRNSYEFQYHGRVYSIPQKWEDWRDQFIRQFPEEEEGIRSFFSISRSAFEEAYTSFAPDRLTPYLPQTEEEMRNYAVRCPNFFRWMNCTWGEFLGTFIKSKEIKEQLSMLTGYVGDAGENTPAQIMFSIMGYFIDGGYRPKGGSGVFADLLVKRLREYGSEVKIHVDVNKILVKDGQVRGVETTKGIQYFAPLVISNVDPRVTYETLLDSKDIPDEIQQKVNRLQPSMSLYTWTAALTRPFYSDRLTTVVLPAHVRLPLNGINIKSYSYHSSAKVDSSLAPKGCGNIIMNLKAKPSASFYKQLTKEQYQACKQEIDAYCRRLLEGIDRAAAESIRFSEVSTPKTVQHYMRTYEGSIYSTKINKNENFPELKTHIEGLYLVGAGVGFGPGIEGVVITGGAVAEQILSKFQKLVH